jgi:hypothetical protein
MEYGRVQSQMRINMTLDEAAAQCFKSMPIFSERAWFSSISANRRSNQNPRASVSTVARRILDDSARAAGIKVLRMSNPLIRNSFKLEALVGGEGKNRCFFYGGNICDSQLSESSTSERSALSDGF